MAFTVEDGSRPDGANSYITVAYFRSHHQDRGRAAASSDIPDADVQVACIEATDYVEKRFGKRFRGQKSTSSQSLQWPRLNAFDNADNLLNDVPVLLQRAVAEYAWIAVNLDRDLAPPVGLPFATYDPETGEATDAGSVLSKSERVGPISESVTYGDVSKSQPGPFKSTGNMTQNLPEYPQADMWIEELLKRNTRMVARG